MQRHITKFSSLGGEELATTQLPEQETEAREAESFFNQVSRLSVWANRWGLQC